MTTYTITQTQLDLLLGVLDRAGTTDDGEYKWDTHSKATKLLQSLTPNGGDAEAAPSTIGFNGLTEAETDESMSVRGLSQKAVPSYELPFIPWSKEAEMMEAWAAPIKGGA